MVLRWSAVALAAGLLVGCGKSGSGGHSSSQSSSSGQGKTYAPDAKGAKGAQAGATSGSTGGGTAVLPMPADTANGKASAASDEGTVQAAKGQAVVNPGAPSAEKRGGGKR